MHNNRYGNGKFNAENLNKNNILSVLWTQLYYNWGSLSLNRMHTERIKPEVFFQGASNGTHTAE